MDVIKSSALELGLSIERAKEADFLENYSKERGNKIVKNLTRLRGLTDIIPSDRRLPMNHSSPIKMILTP